MNIYVGNFPYELTEEELQDALAAFGHVESVKIIKDQSTGGSRGFGFVEMPNNNEALAAIEKLKEIKGKRVTINEARPQAKRGHHGGGGHGRNSKNFDVKRRAKRY